MVKERKMRFTAVILTVVMLLGMISAVAFAKTGVIAKAANAPVFSLSVVSETSSEVKVSFNLESGSFLAMDLQVNASDWDSASKTTGLILASIEKSQNYKDFYALCEHEYDFSPIVAQNSKNGRVSFVCGYHPYDIIGSMFVYTFTKTSSAKTNVSSSDFLVAIADCTDGSNKSCTPKLINKIPEPTTETTTTKPTTMPTTKQTTELTTSPTTKPTTRPTTAPTTKPNTEAPAFSVTKISETKDEVKLSFNLESGNFTAVDWAVNASDWESASKTTGLTLASIEKSQNYKDFYALHEKDDIPPMVASNNKNGKVSFMPFAPYDVVGSMFIYTFTKTASAKRYVKPTDFIAEIPSCTDSDNKECTPGLIFKFENECKHTSTKHCYVASTCSTNGEEYDLCTKCNEKLNYKKLAKKAHTWSDWQVTVQPTAEKEGYEVRMCSVCETIEKRKIAKIVANVKSVSVSDLKLDYKKSATITPEITADKGAKYTVKYSSSDEKIARVDENGKVYAAKKGTATITCTVTDSNGNTVTDTCNVPLSTISASGL